MNLWRIVFSRSFLQLSPRRPKWILGLWLSSTASNSFVVQSPIPQHFNSPLSSSTPCRYSSLSFLKTMSESPALRRSTRAASSTNSIDKVDENEEATNVVANEPAKKAAKKKKPAAAKKEVSKASAKKSPKRTKKEDDSSVSSQEKPKKKRAKAPPHQRITERDPLPKLWDPSKASNGSYSKFAYHCCISFLMKLIPLFLLCSIQDCLMECCWIACHSSQHSYCSLGSSPKA